MEYRGLSHRRLRPTRATAGSLLLAAYLLLALPPGAIHAEIRIVNAEGTHLLGQHDTRDDAIRLATEAAKRDALEQVATYLESVTVSNNLDVSRDEIRSYTAGVVTVIDEQMSVTADGDQVAFHVVLTAQVDTDDVAEAVRKLREHEEVWQELAALKTEVDQLQQDLEKANLALAGGLSSEEAKELADRRTDLLNQMQSNALVQQAWTEWMMGNVYFWPYGYGVPSGMSVPGLLALAGRLNPNNPHVPAVTTILTARTGAPVPPAPPQPPVPPGNVPSIPPHQQLVPPLQIPANAVIGNTPGSHGYRRLQSLLPQIPGPREAAPSFPRIQRPPGSPHAPTQPGSAQRLRHFLAPPAASMPPSSRVVPLLPSSAIARQFPSIIPGMVPSTHRPGSAGPLGFSRPQRSHPGSSSHPISSFFQPRGGSSGGGMGGRAR